MAAVSVVVTLGLGASNAATADEIPIAQIAKEGEINPIPLYFSYTDKADIIDEKIEEETTPLSSGGSLGAALRFAEILPVEKTELQSSESGEIPLDEIDLQKSEPENNPQREEKTELQSHVYTDEEKEMIAKVVFAEARGESFDGQVAVAQVVINRFESGNFGRSIKTIVYGRNQFAVGKRYNESSMEAVEYAVSNKPYPANMYFFQVSKRKHWRDFIYYDRIGNHSFYCHNE